MRKRCDECDTKLVSLYFRERHNGKLRWVKIDEKYCRNCNKPMLALNWFAGDNKVKRDRDITDLTELSYDLRDRSKDKVK